MELKRAARHFLEMLPDGEGGSVEALEKELCALWRRAREVWPNLDVSIDSFARYLAERAPGGDCRKALADLHTSDLYLACACNQGIEIAFRLLEERYRDQLERGLSRMKLVASQRDEVAQRLREKLLLPDQKGARRIARYSGRGPLGAWYRVSAIHAAVDLLRSEGRVQPVEDAATLDAFLPQVDPELEFLKEAYRGEFKRALHEALGELSSDQRNLLRYHLLDKLTLAQIGALYGLHLSSISRRLDRTRSALLAGTRRNLAIRLSVDDGELDSIMRLIQSHLDGSISRALRSDEG